MGNMGQTTRRCSDTQRQGGAAGRSDKAEQLGASTRRCSDTQRQGDAAGRSDKAEQLGAATRRCRGAHRQGGAVIRSDKAEQLGAATRRCRGAHRQSIEATNHELEEISLTIGNDPTEEMAIIPKKDEFVHLLDLRDKIDDSFINLFVAV